MKCYYDKLCECAAVHLERTIAKQKRDIEIRKVDLKIMEKALEKVLSKP